MKKQNEKPLLVETLLIEKGVLQNIEYHNRRMNRARLDIFFLSETIDLRDIIVHVPGGTHRCRVIYGETIDRVHYLPRITPKRHSFRFVAGDLNYRYKYLDRSAINRLLEKKKSCDDIIIVRNGLVTDASSSNVAFFFEGKWVTPAAPLLEGTTRERYLREGLITAGEVTPRLAGRCEKMALLNAMIDFQVIDNPLFRF